MDQRVKPEGLREMLNVARKLRVSATMSSDASYIQLFARAAVALEARARSLAAHPSDLLMDDDDDADDGASPADLHRHVDFRC